MQAIGTVVNKNKRPIALFQVKPCVIKNKDEAKKYREQVRQTFTGIPVVLVSRENDEILFEGNKTEVELVQNDNLEKYSWRQYTLI